MTQFIDPRNLFIACGLVYCLRIFLLPAEYWALYIVHLRHTVHSKSSYFWNTLYCPVIYVTHTIDSHGKNYFKRAQFSNFCFLNKVENISNWKSWNDNMKKFFICFPIALPHRYLTGKNSWKFLQMLDHKFDMRKLKKKLKVSTFSCQICGKAFAEIFNSCFVFLSNMW